jgi:hypothetical protein
VSVIVRVSNSIFALNHNLEPISDPSVLSEADRFPDSIKSSPDHQLFHRYILSPFFFLLSPFSFRLSDSAVGLLVAETLSDSSKVNMNVNAHRAMMMARYPSLSFRNLMSCQSQSQSLAA